MKFITIKSKLDFKRTCTDGSTFFKSTFILKYLPINTNSVKIGFIVSKKTGNAVRRNKIKRRLRHALSQVINDNVPSGLYVIIAKKEMYSIKFIELLNSLEEAFISIKEVSINYLNQKVS